MDPGILFPIYFVFWIAFAIGTTLLFRKKSGAMGVRPWIMAYLTRKVGYATIHGLTPLTCKMGINFEIQ